MPKLMLVFCLLCCVFMKAAAQQEIFPGVWKIRFGTPEQLTPTKFRSAPPSSSLSKLAHSPPPFDLRSIEFNRLGNGCRLELPFGEHERIYGLGLNTKLFELSGKRAWVIPSDNPEATTNESHAPEPFYVSSAGYGVYVDTARYASFYIGNADRVDPSSQKRDILADIPGAAGVDVYVFAGPTALEAVQRYNLFSGGGCVPPLWGLGIAYRGKGDFTADDALSLAKSFRDTHVPCDIFGIEPGWQTKTYSSSFVWNRTAFPDPDAFIKSMHDMGYAMSFWEHPFTHPSSPIYHDLLPFAGDYRVWGGLVPDFATEGGRRVYLKQQNDVLLSKGVESFKIDEVDNQPFRSDPWSFPDASRFPSGLDGEQMHSLFGVLAQQTMLEPYVAKNQRTWGLVRNSGALAAPLPYTIYSDSYDAHDYVRGMAKIGFGGHMWVPEVRDASSVDDLIRRIQTVIFSPYAMLNCWYMKSPPWLQIDRDLSDKGVRMPEAKQTTDRVRRLFQLRMSLIPYLYSAFNEYRLAGTPVVRALTLDYPTDLESAEIDDQFMVGPSLMVAPMFGKETKRSIYFPPGEWFDFYSGAVIEGGRRVDIAKSLDEVPLYVKANTLLPLAEPVEHVLPSTMFRLHVRAYGAHPVPFTLFEDDGLTLDFEHGQQNRVRLSWPNSVTREGAFTGRRYQVVDWTQVVQ